MAQKGGLLVLVLLLVAGCRAAEPQPTPPETEALTDAKSISRSCPDPNCARSRELVAPVAAEGAEGAREAKARALEAAIRGPGSLTLDAEAGTPVRGPMESQGKRTLVEVCVTEVAAAGPQRPALVRFTMRLCSEDGATNGKELRVSKRPGWNYDALPEGWSSDEVSGVPFHRYFSCEGGTAWEIDAIADELEGGGARFTVRGEYRF